jgi:hypothetical protein
MPEQQDFYSSDGTTTGPLWDSAGHNTSSSNLSRLFLDSASIAWPEIDVADYSPSAYSDSDHQTGFSSGLSSNSSPDGYAVLESEYSQYGLVSLYGRRCDSPGCSQQPPHQQDPQDWNNVAYTAELSPSSEFHNLSEHDSSLEGSTQTYLNDHSAYRNVAQEDSIPERCVNLSQLVAPSCAQPEGIAQSLSIETVVPLHSAKSSATSYLNGGRDEEDDDDDDGDEWSARSSSDYRPSPSPNTESKRSIRHHPYGTINRHREVNQVSGTFRTISPRSRKGSDRPCAPIPVPVPNLTKKSRGRKVPTVYEPDPESVVDDYVSSTRLRSSSDGGKVKKGGAVGARTYKCVVEDCGKCFVRGEHLKRHIRSIHTHEKRRYSFFLVPIRIPWFIDERG